MKHLTRTALVGLAASASIPAFAHHSVEGASTLSTLAHWFANPVHAAPIVAALAIVGFLAIKRASRG